MISYPAKGKLRRTHKIILLGDSGVGKTSLVEKYVHGSFLEEFNVRVLRFSLLSA